MFRFFILYFIIMGDSIIEELLTVRVYPTKYKLGGVAISY
jgi:hypothetical protein